MEKCEEPPHFGVFFSLEQPGELRVISFNKKISTRRDQEASPRPNPLTYVRTYYKILG
jgi:hypothetical protein